MSQDRISSVKAIGYRYDLGKRHPSRSSSFQQPQHEAFGARIWHRPYKIVGTHLPSEGLVIFHAFPSQFVKDGRCHARRPLLFFQPRQRFVANADNFHVNPSIAETQRVPRR